jgi:tetratricopeptide (TPR) repeat protein
MVFDTREKKRMNINLKSEEERVNLLPDFIDLREKCLSNSPNSNHYFSLLIKIWDLNSEILWAQGYWEDYRNYGEIALDCATKLSKRDIEGRILNELGWAQMEQENFDIAQRCFLESLQVFKMIGDRVGQGQSLRYMGVLQFRRHHFGLALKSYREALKMAQDGLKLDPLNQRLLHQESELHNLLGNFYFKLWNIKTSRRELVAGLRGYRILYKLYVAPTPSSNSTQNSYTYLYFQSAPLLTLGRVAMLSGRYRKAERYFKRCVRLCKRIDRPDTKAGVLFRMAELAKLQGKNKKAEKLAKKAGNLAEKEIPSLQKRTQNFRSQQQGDRREQLKALRHKIRIFVTLSIDLLVNAPLVLLQSIGYYGWFLGAKLAAKIRR